MDWDKDTEAKFKALIGKIPAFLRPVAQDKVSTKASKLAQAEGRTEIVEKHLVDAFFAETPFGFHGPMKTDMQEVGIDYTKYGYEK